MTCLGVDQCGRPPSVTISSARYWRLWHALDVVLKRGRASSLEVECLVGHLTFAFLVRRPLLSCFRSVYDFMQGRGVEQRPLWSSVRRELEMAKGLLILSRADLTQKASPRVFAYDACPSGHASCSWMADVDEIARTMSWHE